MNYEANKTVLSSASWTTNLVSAALPLTQYDKAGLMFSWSSLTGTLTTTSFDIEVSNDGTNWAAITASIGVGSTANGTDAVSITDLEFAYLRVRANIGAATGGSFLVTATLKR